MVDKNAREIFVRNMHRFMEEKGITQADIAGQMNLTASTVSDWYNGKNYPRVDAMQRLAALLDVSMRELTTDTEGEFILSSEEAHVLSVYRSLTAEGRKQFMVQLTMVANMFTSEKNNNVPVPGALK